jgi:hypothetical protein
LCEVIQSEYPDLPVDVQTVRPHLRLGFPWHASDVVRDPASADAWWVDLRQLFSVSPPYP